MKKLKVILLLLSILFVNSIVAYAKPNQSKIDNSYSVKSSEEVDWKNFLINWEKAVNGAMDTIESEKKEKINKEDLSLIVEQILNELEIKAEQGNIASQIFLGFINQLGLHVNQNYKKAIYWYEKASNQESISYHVFALVALGYMHEEGLGVNKNYKTAFNLYKKALDKGFTEIRSSMGVMYLEGLGVELNHFEALNLFEKASANDDEASLFYLGKMYENGFAVDKNYKKAFNLYKKAEKEYLNALKEYDFIDRIENKYSINEKFEELDSYFNTLDKRQQKNDVFGNYLDSFINNFSEVFIDVLSSEKIMNKLKNISYLEVIYSSDESKEIILNMIIKLFKYFKEDTQEGLSDVQYSLASMYQNGLSVRQDLSKAKEYYGLSCDNGLQEGCDNYKKLNEQGY